jgi:hypothetical protein
LDDAERPGDFVHRDGRQLYINDSWTGQNSLQRKRVTRCSAPARTGQLPKALSSPWFLRGLRSPTGSMELEKFDLEVPYSISISCTRPNAGAEPCGMVGAYGTKHLGECVMSHKRNKRVSSPLPRTSDLGDLKDWATIGLIVVSSSLLVWGPFLIA